MEDPNKQQIVAEIEKVLDEIRPSLQSHGGDAFLRDIKDDKVYIDLHGACHGCPMSEMTFGIVVDEMIKRKLPQIKEVIYE